MCIEINNAFLSTLVCKMFCQTNKKSCEDQNNHCFARELNFIFTNSFYWNISNWQKSFGGIGREIGVSRTDFLASPQFGLNPDPAANLQTNNDKKTVKNNKMSRSLSYELKTVSHDYVIMKEGKVEIECSRKVKCHEVGLSACTGGPLPGPSCVSWTLIWVFP